MRKPRPPHHVKYLADKNLKKCFYKKWYSEEKGESPPTSIIFGIKFELWTSCYSILTKILHNHKANMAKILYTKPFSILRRLFYVCSSFSNVVGSICMNYSFLTSFTIHHGTKAKSFSHIFNIRWFGWVVLWYVRFSIIKMLFAYSISSSSGGCCYMWKTRAIYVLFIC